MDKWFQARTREELAALRRRPRPDVSQCTHLTMEQAMGATVIRGLRRQKAIKDAEDAQREVASRNRSGNARRPWPMK